MRELLNVELVEEVNRLRELVNQIELILGSYDIEDEAKLQIIHDFFYN